MAWPDFALGQAFLAELDDLIHWVEVNSFGYKSPVQ